MGRTRQNDIIACSLKILLDVNRKVKLKRKDEPSQILWRQLITNSY